MKPLSLQAKFLQHIARGEQQEAEDMLKEEAKGAGEGKEEKRSAFLSFLLTTFAVYRGAARGRRGVPGGVNGDAVAERWAEGGSERVDLAAVTALCRVRTQEYENLGSFLMAQLLPQLSSVEVQLTVVNAAALPRSPTF